jgi:hypothetical protein
MLALSGQLDILGILVMVDILGTLDILGMEDMQYITTLLAMG